jgi:hypothetical protein
MIRTVSLIRTRGAPAIGDRWTSIREPAAERGRAWVIGSMTVGG